MDATDHGSPVARLGILGGGQLGKMTALAARALDVSVVVLDPDPQAPARGCSDSFVLGSYADPAAIRRLAAEVDVCTMEIEHVDTTTLQELERGGMRVRPGAAVLATVQDKLAQRRLFAEVQIPQPRFEVLDSPDPAALARFGLPAVQKLRRGGYDGRGVAVVRTEADPLLPGPSILEELVDIRMELGLLVVRRPNETRVYPPTRMVFHEGGNICTRVEMPARLDPALAARAAATAEQAADALQLVGVLAVELFVTADDRILLNEVAPRPHNSGHLTTEACRTSQFEQHVRAVLNLPLGSTDQILPAVMINLLGTGPEGPTRVRGLRRALAIPGVSVHLYGKTTCRPLRKMGHVTVTADSLDRARELADEVESVLQICGTPNGGER